MKFPISSEDVKLEVFHIMDVGQSVDDQRYRQYKKILKEVPDEILFEGLIKVFSDTSRGVKHYQLQNIAGSLLEELDPKSNQTLKDILNATLENYNLSIQQLPIYLAKQFGKGEVLKQLSNILQQSKNPEIKESTKTFEYWLTR